MTPPVAIFGSVADASTTAMLCVGLPRNFGYVTVRYQFCQRFHHLMHSIGQLFSGAGFAGIDAIYQQFRFAVNSIVQGFWRFDRFLVFAHQYLLRRPNIVPMTGSQELKAKMIEAAASMVNALPTATATDQRAKAFRKFYRAILQSAEGKPATDSETEDSE